MPSRQLERVLDRLPNPKAVGQSEYTLLHEFVSDLAEGGTVEEVQASVDELSRWARHILIECVRETNTW